MNQKDDFEYLGHCSASRFALYILLLCFSSALQRLPSQPVLSVQCSHGHSIWWTKIHGYNYIYVSIYPSSYVLQWHFDYEVKISPRVETKANTIFNLEIIWITSPIPFFPKESKTILYLFNKKKWEDQVSCNKWFQSRRVERELDILLFPECAWRQRTASQRAELLIPHLTDSSLHESCIF